MRLSTPALIVIVCSSLPSARGGRAREMAVAVSL
jgi:hypothetical protein